MSLLACFLLSLPFCLVSEHCFVCLVLCVCVIVWWPLLSGSESPLKPSPVGFIYTYLFNMFLSFVVVACQMCDDSTDSNCVIKATIQSFEFTAFEAQLLQKANLGYGNMVCFNRFGLAVGLVYSGR